MQAVIFDMDGTLLASEHLWKQAEKTVFTALGVDVKPELVPLTKQMSAPQVIAFWYARNPWQHRSFAQVDQDVIDQVAALIYKEGQPLPGVITLLDQLKQHDIAIALATNAPKSLIPVVFNTLNIGHYFTVTVSTEDVFNSKPAPDVYLAALDQLGLSANQAVAIEDTPTGFLSANSAGIKTVVVPEPAKRNDARFKSADLIVDSLEEVNVQRLRTL